MKEMILTHISRSKEAIIALVDYDTYTVSLKKIPLEDTSLETGDLSELIKSDKLRVYRDDAMYSRSCDAWLAFDPVRGCLAVTYEGVVVCKPAAEYLSDLYDSSTGEHYSPKYLGKPITSFYDEVKAIEKRLKASLRDEVVCHEIANVLGVRINYSHDLHSWTKSEVYTVNLYGRSIDRVDLVGKSDNLQITLKNGNIDEVWVNGSSKVTISARDEIKIGRIKVAQKIEELEFRLGLADVSSYPELVTDATTCALYRLGGYNRPEADLTVFKNLILFDRCWSMKEHLLSPINVKLPGAADTCFVSCFQNVNIQGLFPYKKDDNALDLTGIEKLKTSFKNFCGVSFIRGTVTSEIDESFISNEFDGNFEVTARTVCASFGYVYKKSYSLYSNSSDTEIKVNSNVEGIVHINFNSQNPTAIGQRGSSEFIAGSFSTNDVRPWKQTHILTYDEVSIPNLVIYLNKAISFIVDAKVHVCSVRGRHYSHTSDYDLISPTFNKPIHLLKSGEFPYDTASHYDDKCFSGGRFRPTYLCVLPEDILQTIGDRAFYTTKGIDYLVIPRSCYRIGTAAFSEMLSNTGDLTTICVYRDSYGHDWSKGKKLKVKVIDSLEDIPKPTSTKTENDFLAAFIDTPAWAENSKVLVAKVLTMAKINLSERISVVSKLTPDISSYFQQKYAALPKTIKDKNGNDQPNLVESGETDQSCADGCISRSALHAATLNALYGSCVDLLNIEVLDKFNWSVRQAYEVMRWVGTPKVSSFYGGYSSLQIYLRGDEVLYVGCGYIDDTAYRGVDKVSWSVPEEVFSSDTLFGPDIEGRLNITTDWGSNYFSVAVHGELFKGDASDNLQEFIQRSMVLVSNSGTATSGRISVKTKLIYDIGNHRLYKFSGTYNSAVGTYRGEVNIEEYREKRGLSAVEQKCLTSPMIKIGKVEPAPPSFELEFCRTQPKFNLMGNNPRVDLLIELLSKSGLVKRATQSTINNRIDGDVYTNLSDGTKVVTGKTASGNTYMLGITTAEGKFHGFEAGFNMLDFAQVTDDKVVRRKAYSNPKGGYFTVVKDEDLFAVTPVERVQRYGEGYTNSGLFLALDFTSGKLVQAYSDTSNSCVVCSFASAKDARDYYTEFACKFFARPEEFFSSSLKSVIYLHSVRHADEESVVVFDVHPHSGNSRITNSLLALGDYKPMDSHSIERGVYNETILKYCRI